MADGAPATAQQEEQISEELLQVHRESYGVGGRVTTHVLDDSVLVVIDVDLTTAERTLLDAGQADAVKGLRESYQVAIAPTFKAVVERATGRRVDSFASHMSVEALYSIEFFRLAPEGRRYQTA
jgi:uncharacterized protein YbcI